MKAVVVISNPKKSLKRAFEFLLGRYAYTVTCLYDIPPYCDLSLSKEERKAKMTEYRNHGGARTFGWYHHLKDAKKAILENRGDIHECSYKYAIIERLSQGVHGGWMHGYEEYWYEWSGDDWRETDSGGYHPIDKPELVKKVIGWSWG